LRNKFTQG